MSEEDFDDIRSFRDEEVGEVISRLSRQEVAMALMSKLLPPEKLVETSRVRSVFEFQESLMKPIFVNHILPTFRELTVSGLENVKKDRAYLFISNHRDIVLDSAILNYFLHEKGISTAEIAIGDNLLKEPWIKDLVRLNKSFIVKRNLDKTEMLEASKHMSAYISHTIKERGESVWIAQRAGRAKDGNDKTNPGLINMLSLGAEGDLVKHFSELHILPVSISYEYDPCDLRKTRELYTEQSGVEYIKAENEDVESMALGIVEDKGKGHIHFGRCLDNEILSQKGKDRKEVIAFLCQAIDRQIRGNYHLWPSNTLAREMLDGKDVNGENGEVKDLVDRLEKVYTEIPGDRDSLRNIFLGMYAQPAINKVG